MSKSSITGIDEAIESLDKAVGVEKLVANMTRACLIVERAAKENAPKGNGDLRRSITHTVVTEGEEVKGKVYTPLEYAPYVEYGTGLFAEGGNGRQDVPWCYRDEKTGEFVYTSGQHPIPYLRPALEDNRLKVIEELQKGLLDNG